MKCLIPGCTNREGDGRFEGPLCSPCAQGLRSNGAHQHDAASKLLRRPSWLEVAGLWCLKCREGNVPHLNPRLSHQEPYPNEEWWDHGGEDDEKVFTCAAPQRVLGKLKHD